MCAERCGLLGEKLGHSFSPQIHAMLADYEYKLFPMPKEEVENFMKNGAWDAINVTIPYKETVIPFLDTISDEARSIGSVNTVVRDKNNRLHGYNTDFYGFSHLVKSMGFDISGKKCIVLGSGGSCKTVRCVLNSFGVREIITVSRSGENNYDNIARHYDAEIIVNTTPVGMYPNVGKKLLDLEKFEKCEGVLDLIYNPATTALLLDAERLGIKHSNGLPMLVAQAKKACEIFNGTTLDDATIETVLKKLRLQMMNVVLIGMPACGKTTVGKLLAQNLSHDFCDIDEKIAESGRTPAEIITSDGEAAFRKIEGDAVSEIGKQSGKIIATGGGVVTRDENYVPLHQNGKIIFIDRSPERLNSDGRPLSKSVGVQKLYAERLPLYKKFADATVDGNATPENVVDGIIEILEKIL